ncbi:MAG TPA: caspase family protein [Patescibacteria group bacterium]|nr:caspase family protein [Patescibacteria group bacterium]
MSKRIIAGWLFVFWAGACFLSAQGPAPTAVKRYAVVIGANNGGKKRVRLRYAVSDARSFQRVMGELGGVAYTDCLLLLDPEPETIFFEIGKFQAQVENARARFGRIELIFYYSGHSDETHLLLNEGKISYKRLRQTINRFPADVRIAILDSCASGAFTRLKGGKRMPSFLSDEAYNMQGYAFLTSSSSTEASQESDLLKSSFFTHYLNSALRGAADLNQDGRVTLNEAYQFTFSETLAETTQTLHGPQHPNYDIQMSGTGDVVMTEIRNSSAILVLGIDLSGRFFIHDQNNRLVMELSKPAGRKIILGLDQGKYRLINIAAGRIFKSEINLRAGKDLEVGANGFVRSAESYTTPRGDRILQMRKEFLSKGFVGRPITTNVSMPTGRTLNQGELVIGLGPVSYGISDRVQIGTNASDLINEVFNADLKAALARSGLLGLAAGLNWDSFHLDVAGEDSSFYSLSPYISVSPLISNRVTLHFSGRYSFFSDRARVRQADFSTKSKGSSVMAGLEFSLSNRTKLLYDVGYDTTYDMFRSGAALLFGRTHFRIKLGFQLFRNGHGQDSSKLLVGMWWRLGD